MTLINKLNMGIRTYLFKIDSLKKLQEVRDLVNKNNKNIKHSLDKIVDEDCFLEYENKYYLECTSGTDSIRAYILFDTLNKNETCYWEPFVKPEWFFDESVVISDNICLEETQISIMNNYKISDDSLDEEQSSDEERSSDEEWSSDEELLYDDLFASHIADILNNICNAGVE